MDGPCKPDRSRVIGVRTHNCRCGGRGVDLLTTQTLHPFVLQGYDLDMASVDRFSVYLDLSANYTVELMGHGSDILICSD